MKKKYLITGSIAIIVIVLSFWYLLSSPLPSLDNISKMEFSSIHGKYEVAKEHWPAIWQAMSPASRDWSPSKWQTMGDLHLTLKQNQRYRIWLYRVEGTGAFSAGTTRETRTYYRGGNSEQLKQALERAKPTP